eukprot:COSAG06_NODE_740_length_12667_cov_5.783180_5_plen_314_part_00
MAARRDPTAETSGSGSGAVPTVQCATAGDEAAEHAAAQRKQPAGTSRSSDEIADASSRRHADAWEPVSAARPAAAPPCCDLLLQLNRTRAQISSAVADGDDKQPETAEPGPIEETTAAPETTGLVSGGADAGLDVSMAEVKPVNDCSFNSSAVADGDDKQPETAEPGPIEETDRHVLECRDRSSAARRSVRSVDLDLRLVPHRLPASGQLLPDDERQPCCGLRGHDACRALSCSHLHVAAQAVRQRGSSDCEWPCFQHAAAMTCLHARRVADQPQPLPVGSRLPGAAWSILHTVKATHAAPAHLEPPNACNCT